VSSLLLVEDDRSLGETLTERLRKEGYEASWARTKADAWQVLRETQPDLCIIDIGLPDGSGIDLALDMRKTRSIPFIFLTAMSSAEHRLEGYQACADEYVPKPFYLKELLLKIRKVLERAEGRQLLQVGDIKIDFNQRSITLPDGTVEFPAGRDFALLRMLIELAPCEVSREDILARLWEGEKPATARTVDNAIVRLRQIFRRAGLDCIRSVRGIGYQWFV